MGRAGAGPADAIRGCADALSELRRCAKALPGARLSLSGTACEELLDRFQECVALSIVPREELERARSAVEALGRLLERAVPAIGARGWLLPRETADFAKDPLEHVKKKLFLYTLDLLRRRIGIEAYASKARAAASSSMRSNMRTIYEAWVLASMVARAAELSARLVYPEHGLVHFDRQGKQVAGTMPPNLVLEIPGRGMLSIYLEAPRPLGWRDFKDLRRVWRFYTSLRPDIMAYPGLVLDIVDMGSDGVPILRPGAIIECKELDDWFERHRELKGPANPSLSFDEWFKRWLSGLWTGLADVVGVDSSAIREAVEGRRRGLRVSEVQLVKLYMAVYRPRHMFLVSSPRLPGPIRSELESEGIAVYDGVRMGDEGALVDLADEVLAMASPAPQGGMAVLSELSRQLARRGLAADGPSIVRLALQFALSRLDEFSEFVASS
ncbi:MAG: hypothetical protein ABWK00_02385 [Desulfurococcaceae archaeon]